PGRGRFGKLSQVLRPITMGVFAVTLRKLAMSALRRNSRLFPRPTSPRLPNAATILTPIASPVRGKVADSGRGSVFKGQTLYVSAGRRRSRTLVRRRMQVVRSGPGSGASESGSGMQDVWNEIVSALTNGNPGQLPFALIGIAGTAALIWYLKGRAWALV